MDEEDEEEEEKRVYTTLYSDSAQVQEILTRGIERVRSEMEIAGQADMDEKAEEKLDEVEEVRARLSSIDFLVLFQALSLSKVCSDIHVSPFLHP